MNQIVINESGIFSKDSDGNLVRFEDQEGTKKALWSTGTFADYPPKEGIYQIPFSHLWEIVIQWQVKYQSSNPMGGACWLNITEEERLAKVKIDHESETRQVAILKKKNMEPFKKFSTLDESPSVASDSTVTPSPVETGEQKQKRNPIFYKSAEEMDKPLSVLMEELRIGVARIRGKLHDIKHSFGWEERIIDLEGGLTCMLVAMYNIQEEWEKFEAKGKLKTSSQDSKNNKAELLTKYSEWLCEHGYTDTDWKDEEPGAVGEFLKTLA